MQSLRARYVGPIFLIALCVMVLGTITAVSIFHQQAEITRSLRENVSSQRAAVELEECLQDLIALEDAQVESVSVLHLRVNHLMKAVRESADQPEEQALRDQLDQSFRSYLVRWQSMPPPGDPNHELARRDATRALEAEVLKPCQEFEHFNSRRVEASAETHERVLRRLAWGMTVVGLLGAIAGAILGYGLARSLARSIRSLRVQLRDAAGMLGPELPEIVVTEVGDFSNLHAEVDLLSNRIQQVVQALQQREMEVLRAEQLAAVGQLAAGVAHEIRNPLTSIKMLVQAAMESAGEPLPLEDLRIIDAEVRRMQQSLQTFLDFARPSKMERRPTDFSTITRSVVDLLRGRAEKQRVDLTLDAPASGPMIWCDGEQVRQVLVNLCLNALDVMPSGGKLIVRVSPVSANLMDVTVSDTGPGITADLLPRLFTPFVSNKDTGLGLGLVISKRIIEGHGGQMVASNRPQGGAEFRFTLPTKP